MSVMYDDWRLGPDRMFLPAGYMQHMPFKKVNAEQLYEVKCHLDYNPIDYYPDGIKPRKNEAGHDQAYRYIYAK